ncbi:MAG: protein translocase subunit SecD, partial [Zymomonas sp.]|nr:protein translocase subunit SecD [Zymomonas sp.]
MLDFPRWKIWSIILVLVLGVFLAVPSLLPSNLDQKFGLGALPRINFGLDLSGGSHILLEADTADVAHQRIVTMEEMVRSQISRAQPAITIGDMSADNDQLSFMVRDNHQLDSAVEAVRTLTNGIGATGQRDWDVRVVDGNRIVMRPTKAGIQSFVNQAMEGATEVVRKRIDSLGTREPIIIRQGSDRIVVQVPGLQNPSALKALIGKTA